MKPTNVLWIALVFGLVCSITVLASPAKEGSGEEENAISGEEFLKSEDNEETGDEDRVGASSGDTDPSGDDDDTESGDGPVVSGEEPKSIQSGHHRHSASTPDLLEIENCTIESLTAAVDVGFCGPDTSLYMKKKKGCPQAVSATRKLVCYSDGTVCCTVICNTECIDLSEELSTTVATTTRKPTTMAHRAKLPTTKKHTTKKAVTKATKKATTRKPHPRPTAKKAVTKKPFTKKKVHTTTAEPSSGEEFYSHKRKQESKDSSYSDSGEADEEKGGKGEDEEETENGEDGGAFFGNDEDTELIEVPEKNKHGKNYRHYAQWSSFLVHQK